MPLVPVQLALDLPHLAEYSRAAFLVGPCNAAGLALIDRWPDWPGNAAVIWGGEGTGKSHLCRIWCEKSGAQMTTAGDLTSAESFAALMAQGLAIEGIDAAGVPEAALFHGLNLARSGQGRLLLTSRRNPAQLAVGLPDLASRLRALPSAALFEPDDKLLRSVLGKLFADRQLAIDPALVDFLGRRMERSFSAALGAVEALDRASLEEGRAITRRFAARVLGPLFSGEGAEGQADLFDGG